MLDFLSAFAIVILPSISSSPGGNCVFLQERSVPPSPHFAAVDFSSKAACCQSGNDESNWMQYYHFC